VSVSSHFGRYRVLQPLAAGEMGVVYLAEDPLIGRKVAIKAIRLDPDTGDAEICGLQDRFEQEIQIAGTFTHPNIVILLDVGRQDGRSFIAMEYVDGRNLRAELQANGPFSVDRAVELIVPVCRALNYAHDRQVIHRDIKPTNILVSSGGVPKITDFGVARLYGSTLTNHGKIFGTPAYMSPEQTIGGNLTGASDQFAIATVAYELLTGERPFKGTSPTAVIYEVIEHHPTPPDEVDPLIPTAVGKVIMRGLEKHPDARYESCDAFADALERAAQWSRQHPDLAFLGDAPPATPAEQIASPPPSLEATVPGWTQWAGGHAARLLEPASALRLTERVRSMWQGVPPRLRSAPAIVGGALTVATLLLFVAWALPDDEAVNAALVAPGGNPERVVNQATATALPAAELPTSPSSMTAPVLGDPSDIGAPAVEPFETEVDDAAAVSEAASEAVAFRITTRPTGALVRLDGVEVGTSDSVSVAVSPGQRHVLRFELAGYEQFSWAFSLDDLSADHLDSGSLHFPLTAISEQPDEASGATGDERAGDDEATTAVDPKASDRVAGTNGGEVESAPANAIPPTPGPVRRVKAPSQTAAPHKITHVEPVVPGTERGVVVLEIEISSRGNVLQAKLLRGLSQAANQAALDAVVQWKYEPSIVDGSPVNVVMTVTLPVNGG